MCRLAVFGGVQEALDIAWATAELELSFGGQGNGLYLTAKDRLIKGLDLSPSKIGKEGYKEEGFGIFHTRLASCGGVKDELCHPFKVDGEAGKFVVAHNGHWTGWWSYSGDEKSDTQTMANLVGEYGMGVLMSDTAKGSGVWVVYNDEDKKVYVVRRSGDFYLQRLAKSDDSDPEVFFHASEPLRTFSEIRRACGQIKQDVFYELKLNGKGIIRQNIEAVTPAQTVRQEYKRKGTQYSSYKGYTTPYASEWERARENTLAYGLDNMYWDCYCTPAYTCSKCKVHETTFNCLPSYDDGGLEWMGLDNLDRAMIGAPDWAGRFTFNGFSGSSRPDFIFPEGGSDDDVENVGKNTDTTPGHSSRGRWRCVVPDCRSWTNALRCEYHQDKFDLVGDDRAGDGNVRVSAVCDICDERVWVNIEDLEEESVLCYACEFELEEWLDEAKDEQERELIRREMLGLDPVEVVEPPAAESTQDGDEGDEEIVQEDDAESDFSPPDSTAPLSIAELTAILNATEEDMTWEEYVASGAASVALAPLGMFW